jgi:cytosine permease
LETIESKSAAPASAGLPPSLEEALNRPPIARKGWQTSIAPTYIGLFLWVVYFDQLCRRTLSIGGLGPSILGAGVGGLLCYLLLYYAPAMWGHKTGRPATVLASSTFGATGSVWFLGHMLGLAQVVWLAVATYYAADWTFQGLISCGLVDPRRLIPLKLGGIQLQSPLFLFTSLAWMYAAALVGHYLVRVIAALMNIYPIFLAIMLALAVLLTLGGIPRFRPLAIDPATSAPVVNGGARAFLLMIQLIFGFFACAGVLSAGWGMVARTPNDVRWGGIVGVAFASWIVATLSLMVVAGALGYYAPPPGLKNVPGVGNFSVRVALLLGLKPRLAGATFLAFGLASLAQTVFGAFVLGNRLSAVWPRLSRLKWTVLGAAVAWLLVATGLPIRLEAIFTLFGAAFAPLAGAMAADYLRSKGDWRGPRQGVSMAGLVAWAVGFTVGFFPLIAAAWDQPRWMLFQPASVFAFVAAFLVFRILAALGAESPLLPVPEPAPLVEDTSNLAVALRAAAI